MIETVFQTALPIGERLVVRKNRIEGTGGPGPRIAVVTGIDGDGLEGQWVAHELAQVLRAEPHNLRGTVDIYPALNPLGVSAAEHGLPLFDLDLNHTFPGNRAGNMNEALAAAIVADIEGADACVDIHAPDTYLREVPHVRVERHHRERLLPLAMVLNTQVAWVHATPHAERSTLTHVLNKLGTPSVVVKMGERLHITADCGSWLTEGILRLIELLGGWSSPAVALPEPRVVRDEQVVSVKADVPGVFLPCTEQGVSVRRGQAVGMIVDPLDDDVNVEVKSPVDGMVMSLRTQPLVYPGSAVARIMGGGR